MADTSVNGDRKEFRVVGKPNLPGVMSRDQATGVAKFGPDYVVPNMLHAKFLRSPYANARIKSIDTKKAKPRKEMYPFPVPIMRAMLRPVSRKPTISSNMTLIRQLFPVIFPLPWVLSPGMMKIPGCI
jgi:hypothetical protein